jgi:DNA polymerase-3 subunit epsilon
MKLFFYDLETTGTKHWRNGIHQISGLIEIDGKVMEEFDFKVRPNPKCEIEDEALRIGNVSRDQIAAYPPMEEVYRTISDMLAKYVNKFDRLDKMFLVGYNNRSFDDAFFRAFFVQNHDEYFGSWFYADSHDTLTLASHRLRVLRTKLHDFKLMSVCKFMGIEVDEAKLHDATYDIYLTRALYYKLENMSPAERIGSNLDAKRDFLNTIKLKNLEFHNDLVNRFLTDKLTLNGFEKDLFNALVRLKNITVMIPFQEYGELICIETPSGEVKEFTTYEDTFKAIIDLL